MRRDYLIDNELFIYENGKQFFSANIRPNNPNSNWKTQLNATLQSNSILLVSGPISSGWQLSGVLFTVPSIVNYNYLNIDYRVTIPPIFTSSTTNSMGIVELQSQPGFYNSSRTSWMKYFNTKNIGTYTLKYDISNVKTTYGSNYKYLTILIYNGYGDGCRYSQYGQIEILSVSASES